MLHLARSVLLLVFLVPWSPASAEPAAEERDAQTFRALLGGIARLDAEARDLLRVALVQARRDPQGQPQSDTCARLLELREHRDLLAARAGWLAVVHGWEAPSPTLPELEAPPRTPAEAALDPVRRMLLRAFERDAARIARTVHLPLLPAPVADR